MRSIVNTTVLLIQLREILSKSNTFYFDTETDSKNNNGLDFDRFAFCYSICCDGNDGGWMVPLCHKPQKTLFPEYPDTPNAPNDLAWEIIFDLFYDPKNTIWIHGKKFDMKVARNHGIDMGRVQAEVYDSMLLAWMVNRDDLKGLKAQVKTRFGYEMEKFGAVTKKHINNRSTPVGAIAPYAIDDVVQLKRLVRVLWGILEDRGEQGVKIFLELENEIVTLVEEMEEHGMLVLPSALEKAKKQLVIERDEIKAELDALVGQRVKVGSAPWLATVLIDRLKLWKPGPRNERGSSGRYSTRKSELKAWANGAFGTSRKGARVAQLVIRWRSVNILCTSFTSTLIDKLDNNSRVHCEFNSFGTRTSRFSAKLPNLMNIPRHRKGSTLPDIRDAFIAREGYYFFGIDYSQVELRVVAHLSRDPTMIAILTDPKGDMHQKTADLCGTSRDDAKVVGFGIFYGMGNSKLAANLDVTPEEAEEFIRRYFAGYPQVEILKYQTVAKTRKNGYVSSLIGGRRYLPDINLPGKTKEERGFRAAAERQCFNTLIQGSAADIIKVAMRNIAKAIKKKGWWSKEVIMLSQVHDEILFEIKKEHIKEAQEIIQYEMENCVKLRVPLRAEWSYGKSWAEAK